MASNKDLVEASSFGRRRLVRAFVSGTSAGQPGEPVSPVRTIVVGFLLALLLLAGAAVTRYVASPATDVLPSAQPAGEGR
jgi:glycerol uptake facilitator-like aquaporin